MNIQPAPEPAPGRFAALLRSALRHALLLLLMAAVSGAAAYGVFELRIRQEQQGTTAQVKALREELLQRQVQMDDKVLRVEKAAEAARLLINQNGDLTSLDARLKEIDTLKLDLQKNREETEAKIDALGKSVVEQVAKQGKETAQALSLELRWKSLLIKAQGEVLLAQVHWAEGNRGLAKNELSIAGNSLRQALEAAPDPAKSDLKQVLDLSEQARAALILEQSSARDSLNLLWHKVSDLLAPPK